jgi:hypothetical protein
MRTITIQEIENGWIVSVFNSELHTVEVADAYFAELSKALTEAEKRANRVTASKEED